MCEKTSYSAILSQIIKAIRIERGIQQKQFAECIGITKGALSKLENDRNSFSVNQLMKICQLLNLGTDYIFCHLQLCAKYLIDQGWEVGFEKLKNDRFILSINIVEKSLVLNPLREKLPAMTPPTKEKLPAFLRDAIEGNKYIKEQEQEYYMEQELSGNLTSN